MLHAIRQDFKAVFDRDPAATSKLEVILTYAGFHALMAYRVAHWLKSYGIPFIPRAISQVARWLTGIEIHPSVRIGTGFFIDHGMGVVIGETAEIGDYVTLFQGVTLGGTGKERGKRHPTLGRNVVIGAGAKVLGPLLVGDGAKIGSNAVVVRDVPAEATAVGIPARLVTADDQDRREAQAAKIGFSQYAIVADMNDPVVQAIHRLLDHAASTEERFNRLVALLQRDGVDCGDAKATAERFDPTQINKMLE